jgi:hypothetical protein
MVATPANGPKPAFRRTTADTIASINPETAMARQEKAQDKAHECTCRQQNQNGTNDRNVTVGGWHTWRRANTLAMAIT